MGAIAGGPIWVAVSLWAGRRTWRSVRRLSARTRSQEHLLEAGQLVGGLAHEIKNPLSTINMNLKLLAEDLSRQQDEAHKRLLRRLESVQHEAVRLKDILDDFLRFAGKVELNPAPTDMRGLIGELVDFFAPQAQAGKVILRTTLTDAPVKCMVDANLVKQALLNLMLNATQAMPNGGELLVRLATQRGQALLEVIDTGVGIPPREPAKGLSRLLFHQARRNGPGAAHDQTNNRRARRDDQG